MLGVDNADTDLTCPVEVANANSTSCFFATAFVAI